MTISKVRCKPCRRDIHHHNLEAHLSSPRHARRAALTCATCNTHFSHVSALLQHQKCLSDLPQNSSSSPEQDPNPLNVLSGGAPVAAPATKQQKNPEKKHACGLCNKKFSSKKAKKAHKASGIHKKLFPSLTCPFSQECSKSFSTPSAMLKHVEDGGCVSTWERQAMNAYVMKNDIEHLITVSSGTELIEKEWEQQQDDEIEGEKLKKEEERKAEGIVDAENEWEMIAGAEKWQRSSSFSSFASISSSLPDTLMSMSLVAPASNSSSAEPDIEALSPTRSPSPLPNPAVFPCPICSHVFKSANALAQHGISPAHADPLFHLPSFGGQCEVENRQFTTLSGLVQHVESRVRARGSADEVERVLNFVDEVLGQFGFGGLWGLRVEG